MEMYYELTERRHVTKTLQNCWKTAGKFAENHLNTYFSLMLARFLCHLPLVAPSN